MASDRRILVAFKCDRDVWFRWKALCRANKVSVEKASEALLQETLQRFGIDIRERSEDQSMKVPGPAVKV